MRRLMKAAAFAAMIAIPGAAFAVQSAPTAKKAATAKTEKAPAVAHKTTAGVVKSSSGSSLVISKGGKDETFVLNPSTETKGTLETGAHVTVHYTMDGKNMVATAITVQPAKAKGKK